MNSQEKREDRRKSGCGRKRRKRKDEPPERKG